MSMPWWSTGVGRAFAMEPWDWVRMTAGRGFVARWLAPGRCARVRRAIWPPWMAEFVSKGRLIAEGGRGRSGPSGGGEI